MKRAILVTVVLLVAVAALVPAAGAQTAQKSTYAFEMYHVALVKPGPNWKPQHDQEGMDVRMQVIENIKRAAAEGLVVTAGLVNDETDVEMILIVRVETKAEALALMNNAPNHKNGFYRAEIYSWFAPKGLMIAPPRSMTPANE